MWRWVTPRAPLRSHKLWCHYSRDKAASRLFCKWDAQVLGLYLWHTTVWLSHKLSLQYETKFKVLTIARSRRAFLLDMIIFGCYQSAKTYYSTIGKMVNTNVKSTFDRMKIGRVLLWPDRVTEIEGLCHHSKHQQRLCLLENDFSLSSSDAAVQKTSLAALSSWARFALILASPLLTSSPHQAPATAVQQSSDEIIWKIKLCKKCSQRW